MRGKFITFEGGEGVGKSSVLKLVSKELATREIAHVCLREPGVTHLGEYIRAYLLDPKSPRIDPVAELLLFNAARAQLIMEEIAPALDDGLVVLCDRYAHSTMAYQHYGRGVDREKTLTANGIAVGSVEMLPDLVVLLDTDVKVGLSRAQNRGEMNAFDMETLAFHERIRDGYRKMAEIDPDRFAVIEASMPLETVAYWANQHIMDLLGE